MYVVIDSRDVVANGYKCGFEREGHACITSTGVDFAEWLQSISDADLASVQAVIVGECADRFAIPALVRSRAKTPIIALKETAGLDETLELFSAGVDDVLKKPALVRELVVRAMAISRRSSDAREEAEFGRLTVYFDGRDPVVDHDSVELPRRERQILEYLVKNRRRRVTKSQLFNAIYGLFNENVDETVIEGHISKLRKKLRQKLGYEVIDAKRFAGYTFVGERVAEPRQPCEVEPATDLPAERTTPTFSVVASNPHLVPSDRRGGPRPLEG